MISMSMTRLPSSLPTNTMMPSFSLQLGVSEDLDKQLPVKRCVTVYGELHLTCITCLTNPSN